MARRLALRSMALIRPLWIAPLLAATIMLQPARSGDDTDAARTVVQSQIDAFQRNDAASAYGFAAPAIRELFPSSDVFMDMVRNVYTPVYRHKRVEIGSATADADGRLSLKAGIVDGDDVAWEALYTLERQSDGSLKIIGCVLRKVGTAV